MRNLATVQKIRSISPIDGADKIELAHVLGWQCVVKKGEFKAGDYCVYFEIDSFLPIDDERYEFLRSSSYKNDELLGEGYRLKTQKFRGQISQGLVLPADLFPELWIDQIEGMACLVPVEGQDVTDLLRVRKYEIPERATSGGTIIGELPGTVKTTDEIRVQAKPELLAEFAGRPYYISTKIDGSSHSISLDENGQFHVTGHHYEYKDDGKSSFYQFVKKNNIEADLRHLAYENDYNTITVQGEWAGPGMQGNHLKLKEPDWFVFTVDIDGKRADLDTMLYVAKSIGAKTVPIEERGTDLPSRYPDIEALLERADGQYENAGKKEGVVIRPIEPVYSMTIHADLSMKVINNKYLLKNS